MILPTSRPLIKKLHFQNVSHFYRGLQNWFLKQEMELFKQEMELFLPLPVLWSKNFFNKNVVIFTQEFKIDFQNKKRNYLNRKRNYLSHFLASDQKTSFTRCFSFLSRNSKLISTQEMELTKQKLELFIPFQGIWSKNFSYKLFLAEYKYQTPLEKCEHLVKEVFWS